MKIIGKCFRILSVFLLCAVTLCPSVNAKYNEEYIEPEYRTVLESGDWQYYENGDSLCVCGYKGQEEIITIPTEINGKSVRKISGRKNAKKPTDTVFFNKSDMFPETDTVKEVIVPEGIISVGIYAFWGSKLEKITLPESLTYIGYKAFNSCTLTSVTIPKNVKNIGDCAFGDSKLEEIYLPEGLESIGESAFENTPLKQIYIPDTVVSIGRYAFRRSELEEITLPKGLVKVESGILANCQSLKKVCISEGTEVLKSSLFSNCKELEEIYLPSTLYAWEQILIRNNSLKSIYFAADESEYNNPLAKEGESLTDSLIKDEWRSTEGFSEIYGNIKVTYNVPVPLAEPIAYPKESIKLDSISIMLLIITVLGIAFTVPLLIAFIRRITESKRKKEAEKIREAKEGFHPEVMGLWQCTKCGTPNSPIANYCYKCGRKGGR